MTYMHISERDVTSSPTPHYRTSHIVTRADEPPPPLFDCDVIYGQRL